MIYPSVFPQTNKLLKQITTRQDALNLQSDIDNLQVWSDKRLLKFHPKKCHVLSLGKLQNITYTHRYRLGGLELEHVFEEKDLGVTIDSKLNFEEHISSKVTKANALVGLIRRSFSFLNGTLFKLLFVSHLRSHLEYCQPVWSPYLKKQINMIENEQRRATKLFDG